MCWWRPAECRPGKGTTTRLALSPLVDRRRSRPPPASPKCPVQTFQSDLCGDRLADENQSSTNMAAILLAVFQPRGRAGMGFLEPEVRRKLGRLLTAQPGDTQRLKSMRDLLGELVWLQCATTA